MPLATRDRVSDQSRRSVGDLFQYDMADDHELFREPPAQSHHCDTLDFDQNSRVGKVGHRDQGAARKFSVGKHFVPNFNESVAVSRIVDRDCHSDEISELAARAIERSVDEGEAWVEAARKTRHRQHSIS